MKKTLGSCVVALLIFTYWMLTIDLPLPSPSQLVTGLLPPSCHASSTQTVFSDGSLKFAVPSAIEVHATDESDHTRYWILFPGSEERLSIMEGPFAGSERNSRLIPREGRTVHERKCGDLDCVDIHSVQADGKQSRLIGTFDETAYYIGVSAAARDFFDSVLDALCQSDPYAVQNWRMWKGNRGGKRNCYHYIIKPLGVEECADPKRP